MPLGGESWIEPLRRVDRPNQETPLINLRWVGPGYFEATRQKLVAGRFLEERDRNLHGAVLSEGEARAVWGTENPIGVQVSIEGRTFTVVGVVADSRNTSLKLPPAKMAYVHYKDRPALCHILSSACGTFCGCPHFQHAPGDLEVCSRRDLSPG
jgi:MacB-like periplasmic core domain